MLLSGFGLGRNIPSPIFSLQTTPSPLPSISEIRSFSMEADAKLVEFV